MKKNTQYCVWPLKRCDYNYSFWCQVYKPKWCSHWVYGFSFRKHEIIFFFPSQTGWGKMLESGNSLQPNFIVFQFKLWQRSNYTQIGCCLHLLRKWFWILSLFPAAWIFCLSLSLKTSDACLKGDSKSQKWCIAKWEIVPNCQSKNTYSIM